MTIEANMHIGLRRADIKCEFEGSRVSGYLIRRSMGGPLAGRSRLGDVSDQRATTAVLAGRNGRAARGPSAFLALWVAKY